ncbi:uncharacterized protein LOC131659235 [Vicia villosa]|uniref:uncharacterized protein LOC131659235 n=1 Tax=Vicia villosa TaxID=3911 RepID=UPI00273B428B|nr:uncharacterized protein LOC131659235 [Vicia villosa]
MDDVTAKSFWRDTEVGYSFSNSLGRSGGILTIWNKEVVDVENSFKGDGFLGIKKKESIVEGSSGFDGEIQRWGLDFRRWEVIGQFIGDRDVSDHCPIWVKLDKVNWGPKPFRFNNEWFSFESFIPFVEGEWKGMKIEGRGDFVLKEKLRLLKEKHKWWNKEVFGRIELEMGDGVREMNLADENLMEDDYANFDENMCLRREPCGRFWKNLRLKENMLLQKSRVNWLKEGDNNSGFFHKVMKQRRRIIHLGPLNHEGGMVDSVEEVREVVFNHFNKKYYEDDIVRPTLDRNFISRAVCSSFLTLIPKCKNPLSLDDYRPICLVGCMYKVVAKLLAGRLKGVLNSIIFNSQSAFVPGRQLLDGVLVANEVVDFARKEGKNCLLFKVDFEKAYDKVKWKFLRYKLKRMGFGDKWMKWMELLIFNSKISLLVNGSPTKEFFVHKGLRKGDPLSLFLFVLVAEGLTGLVKQSIHVGELQKFTLSDSCSVDILQFADDTLIMGEGNRKHVRALKAVLRAFEIVSGLGINFHKSKLIGINSNDHFLDAVSHFLSCKREESSFHFLGIPIGCNPRKESSWNPIVDKMKCRLEGWTNRFLNLGGRITLLKSVLSSLAIFTMSFYKIPSRVVKMFTSIQNKFLWGGVEEKRNIHWVKWSDVNIPFEEGGLGVKNIKLFNFAFLCKWRWRILEGSNSLWYNVLKSRYGDLTSIICDDGRGSKVSSNCSFWWKDLVKVGSSSFNDPIIDKCRFKVHNGFSTPFWESSWLDERPLREEFSVIFDKSCLKKVSVAAMGGWEEGRWKWGDLGVKDGGLGEFGADSVYGALKGRLMEFGGMKEGRDVVVWMGKADTGSSFSVASCYDFLRRVRTPHGPFDINHEAFGILWKSEVPYKVKALGGDFSVIDFLL